MRSYGVFLDDLANVPLREATRGLGWFYKMILFLPWMRRVHRRNCELVLYVLLHRVPSAERADLLGRIFGVRGNAGEPSANGLDDELRVGKRKKAPG